jgi:hypothetical protein
MVGIPCSRKKVASSRMFCFSALFAAIIVIMGPLNLLKAEAAQESLAWTAPATYTNGLPVTDLAGYKLYTGNASGSYRRVSR